MKRTPLRKRSRRAERYARELRQVTPALHARAGGECELASDACEGPLHRHHKKLRSQGGGNDLDSLLLVCEWHHRFIHAYPALSYENGWLVKGVTTTD